jgi:hypothetical protein
MNTTDPVLAAFLRRQHDEAMELAGASDLVRVTPVGGTPPDRYVVEYSCTGLVKDDAGDVKEHAHFVVGIWFPSDYLRYVSPWRVLTWLGPRAIWHPNISDTGPFICVGRLVPGTPLVDLIYQCFEIVTFKKVTMREDDALNRAACTWSRQHRDRFPVDPRALKRRGLQLAMTPMTIARPS